MLIQSSIIHLGKNSISQNWSNHGGSGLESPAENKASRKTWLRHQQCSFQKVREGKQVQKEEMGTKRRLADPRGFLARAFFFDCGLFLNRICARTFVLTSFICWKRLYCELEK